MASWHHAMPNFYEISIKQTLRYVALLIPVLRADESWRGLGMRLHKWDSAQLQELVVVETFVKT